MNETDKGLEEFQGDLNRSLGDLLRELHESRREIARLRAENQDLCSRLGLRSSSPPATRAKAPPSLTTRSPTHVHSSLEHKITLIRSLFRGREDIYAVRWTSSRTGKSGYSPAVRGGWAAAKNRPKSFLPLTDDVVEDHLTGGTPIGIYPLLKDDTCRFLACDFDGDGWALDAGAFLAAAGRHDVAARLERSRSGAGGHVWIFFSAPVPAVTARRLAAGLLREAMVERGEIDLESYDRFFPNQDFLPKGSFGNLIALPLDGMAREQGNTEFVDPGTLEPYPDQWSFLAEVARLSAKDLDQALASLPAVKVGPDALKADIRSTRNRQPAPDAVPCVQRAMLSVAKSGLPAWLLSDIKHLASLHNPRFYEQQRLRLSTFKIPRFVRCYHEDLTHIHLPRGLLEELKKLIIKAGSRLDVRDDRVVPDEIGLSFNGNLMRAQEDAVDSLLKHDLGVLVAPPGVGKTVMACSVIARRSVPTIVLVHRKPLLDQWRAHITELLDLPVSAVGQIGGGRNKPRGVVDLAMIQS
ncbi:MAG: TOTE conflict system archaeo-eukaryotic primase domain-containing protein, partial [Actinomycetota bacterium]